MSSSVLGSSLAVYKTRNRSILTAKSASGRESQMACSCSVSFINNSVSNHSKDDCFDIFKNCGLDDNTATSRYSSAW